MRKDSKYNKSPIESILKQNFQQSLSSLALANHDNIHFRDPRDESDTQHAQFKISGSNGQENIQRKLKMAQMISMSQLQMAIDSISAILRKKILNSTALALIRMKRAEMNQNSMVLAQKFDRILIVRKIQLFFQKMESIFYAKKLRNIGRCFTELSLLRIRGFQKSSSIVSPYRGYSKADNSDRGDSEWDLVQSQGHLGSHENLAKENKLLKKKKQKMKANRQQFYSKMDQMLAVHEAFIKK